MKFPPYFMVLDVEAIGLHGEPFAYGYVVINEFGTPIAETRSFCPRELAQGSDQDRAWVAANVPVRNASRETPRALRDGFWERWRHWADRGAVLVADVAWPVEARFLAACIDDDREARAWQGPYPLHELTSIALAQGADVEKLWADRRENELPAHDPLHDARQSARILARLLQRRPL